MNVKELIAMNAELMAKLEAKTGFADMLKSFNQTQLTIISMKDKEIFNLKSQLVTEHSKHRLLKDQIDSQTKPRSPAPANGTSISQSEFKKHTDSYFENLKTHGTITAIPNVVMQINSTDKFESLTLGSLVTKELFALANTQPIQDIPWFTGSYTAAQSEKHAKWLEEMRDQESKQ